MTGAAVQEAAVVLARAAALQHEWARAFVRAGHGTRGAHEEAVAQAIQRALDLLLREATALAASVPAAAKRREPVS